MSDNTFKRFSYVIQDINVVKKNDKLKAHEILLDYDIDDFIIIKTDLSEWSLLNFIKESTKSKLSNDHLKQSEAHRVVSDKNNGFMSSKQLSVLEDNTDVIKEIKDNLLITENLSDTVIKKTKFDLNSDNELSIYLEIYNGVFIYKMNKAVPILDRPDKEFINIANKKGIRYDLISLIDNDGIFDLVYTENIDILDNQILIESNKYQLINNYIETDTMRLFPVYIIERRNMNIINDQNINGYISNNLLIDDVQRFSIKYNEDTVAFKTSVKEPNETSIISYVSFNGTTIDSKLNQTLNKTVSYKKSPFGLMMMSAINEGTMIGFNKQRQLVCEFLIDRNFISNETLITMFDTQIREKIKINIVDDEYIQIVETESKQNMKYKLLNDEYIFIKIIFNGPLGLIQLSQNSIECGSLNSDLDITELRKYQINSFKTSIGQFKLLNDVTYKNNLLNYRMFDKSEYYGEKLIIDRDLDFSLSKLNNYFSIIMNNSNADKLLVGEKISLNFSNNISDMPDKCFSISDYSGNKITVKENNFNISDIISIENEDGNIFNTEIIAKNNDDLYIEKIPEFNMLNCLIYNILTDSSYFILNTKNLRLNNIKKSDSNIYDINIKNELSLTEDLNIKFKEIYDYSNILKDKNIKSVLFNNNIADKSDLNLNFSKADLTINYNSNRINNNELKTKNNIFVDDKIDLEIQIDLNDYFCLEKIDKTLLEKELNINAEIEMSSGSNKLYLNGNVFNRGNIISKYKLSNSDLSINKDGKLSIIIKTEKDIKGGKLLLGDISIDLSFGENSFIIKENDKVTDFLILKNGNMYLNTDKECTIITKKEVE